MLVDGRRVGVESFPFNSTAKFFDRRYPLASTLVEGKTQITVRFQVTATNEIAPVYALRLTRP